MAKSVVEADGGVVSAIMMFSSAPSCAVGGHGFLTVYKSRGGVKAPSVLFVSALKPVQC